MEDERVFINFSNDFYIPANVRKEIISIGKSHGFEVLDFNYPKNKMMPGEKYALITNIFPSLSNYEKSIDYFFSKLEKKNIKKAYINFKHNHQMKKIIKTKIFEIAKKHGITIYNTQINKNKKYKLSEYSLKDLFSLDLSSKQIEKFFSELEKKKKNIPVVYFDFTGTVTFINTIKEIAWKYGIRIINFKQSPKAQNIEKADICLYDICGNNPPTIEKINEFFHNYAIQIK